MKLNRADALKAKELAEKHGISIEEMHALIGSPYSLIQKKTKELYFIDNMTREEFDKMKTNFNIPCIGKSYASYYMYNEIQKKNNKKD